MPVKVLEILTDLHNPRIKCGKLLGIDVTVLKAKDILGSAQVVIACWFNNSWLQTLMDSRYPEYQRKMIKRQNLGNPVNINKVHDICWLRKSKW